MRRVGGFSLARSPAEISFRSPAWLHFIEIRHAPEATSFLSFSPVNGELGQRHKLRGRQPIVLFRGWHENP
jgi:hypothetical protein